MSEVRYRCADVAFFNEEEFAKQKMMCQKEVLHGHDVRVDIIITNNFVADDTVEFVERILQLPSSRVTLIPSDVNKPYLIKLNMLQGRLEMLCQNHTMTVDRQSFSFADREVVLECGNCGTFLGNTVPGTGRQP